MSDAELRSKAELTSIVGTEKNYTQEAGSPFTVKWWSFNTLRTWILTWIYPVGSFYVQYPAAASNTDETAFPTSARPATMFGGTWVEQFGTEGAVFQTAGYDGAGRTNGLMADQFQGHFHQDYGHNAGGALTAVSGVSNAVSIAIAKTLITGAREAVSDGTNGTPRTGTKTSHTNRLMKLWKRTVL